jgi:O-antigen/teichoic acid export membrane protein
MQRAVISTALWIGGGYALTLIIRIASSCIMTRLVAPQVFGLMTLVNAFLVGLHMFSDVGIGTSIIQHARGDEDKFQNTAWSVQVLRGLLLWLCSALIAWPISCFYNEPLLLWLIPAVGFTAALDGFNCTSMHTLGRRLMRGRLVLLDVAVTLAATAVPIACIAAVYPNEVMEVLRGQRQRLAYDQALAWALVGGNVAAALLRTSCTHLLLPGFRNRWCWDPDSLRELLSFGKWVFLSTMCTFFAFQSDRLLVPKLLDFQTLGVYGIALSLVNVATSLMSVFAAQLVFPLYSRLQQAGREIRGEFAGVHRRAAAFAAVMVTGLLACGPTAVRAVYPPDFHAAGWMVVFLAVGAWFQMLEATAGAALLARGKAGAITISNGTKFLGLLLFVPTGFWLGNQLSTPLRLGEFAWHGRLSGMLLGFVASDVARYFMVIFIARCHGMSAWRYDVFFSVFIVLIGLGAANAGQWAAGHVLGAEPSTRAEQFLLLVCQGAFVVVFWSLLLGFSWSGWQRKCFGSAQVSSSVPRETASV